MLFTIYIWIVMWKERNVDGKMRRLAHLFKKNYKNWFFRTPSTPVLPRPVQHAAAASTAGAANPHRKPGLRRRRWPYPRWPTRKQSAQWSHPWGSTRKWSSWLWVSIFNFRCNTWNRFSRIYSSNFRNSNRASRKFAASSAEAGLKATWRRWLGRLTVIIL